MVNGVRPITDQKADNTGEMVDAQVKLLYNCNFIAAIHRIKFVCQCFRRCLCLLSLVRMICAIAIFNGLIFNDRNGLLSLKMLQLHELTHLWLCIYYIYIECVTKQPYCFNNMQYDRELSSTIRFGLIEIIWKTTRNRLLKCFVQMTSWAYISNSFILRMHFVII